MLYKESSFTHGQDIYSWENSIDLPAGIRVNGSVTFEGIEEAISRKMDIYGIPVVFSHDQIQSGNMLSKQHEDCLVMKNAEHLEDYFHFVFTIRKTGNVSAVAFYRSGVSPRSKQSNIKEDRKHSDNLFENILGVITKTDEQGLETEYDYYAIVANAINEIFNE